MLCERVVLKTKVDRSGCSVAALSETGVVI